MVRYLNPVYLSQSTVLLINIFRALLFQEKDPQRWRIHTMLHKEYYLAICQLNFHQESTHGLVLDVIKQVGDDFEPYEPQRGQEGYGLLE